MQDSGVGFGTSGARGLVEDMTDKVCYLYTKAFVGHLESSNQIKKGCEIAVAGDLRDSTERIMVAVFKAISDMSYIPLNCGKISTPAVSFYGIQKKIPSIMVTGSHIPDDRNGIKFNHPGGEILKSDELSIKSMAVDLDDSGFDAKGLFSTENKYSSYPLIEEAKNLYSTRYIKFFGKDFLKGFNLGFYQHSAVGRDDIPQILENLGAKVTLLKRSEKFIPVDTEAIRDEDTELAKEWSKEYQFDSIYSTDGDSDRPLISNENGEWLTGDILGILTSSYLKADSVSAPVSCNSALEKSGLFKNVERTRIGSPYVIESMQKSELAGYQTIVGYEANGGYLLQSTLKSEGASLDPLPTRDTLLAFLGLMGLSKEKGKPISGLQNELPPRFTVSGRLKEFPTDKSNAIVSSLNTGNKEEDFVSIEELFNGQFGKVKDFNSIDGLRITFESELIIHLRPSGNAPEFRCYVESDTSQNAAKINGICLKLMESLR